MTLTVTIDSREGERITSARKYYTEQGLEVKVAELPIGDYVFTDGTDSVIFEFKLITDFVTSIQDGRIFNQAITQTEEYNHHFVLIHGDLYTRHKAIAISQHYQPINVQQYLSAIASLNRYTTVIETYNPTIQESYHRMMIQAEKCLTDRPIVKKFPKKHKNPAFNYLCYCIYGISSKKAQAIIDTHNLETLTDLMNLTIEDLTIIDGIGKKTAENIINSIQ